MVAGSPDSQGRTYYDILGLPVPPTPVSLQEIKAGYHRALLASHPDKVSGASGSDVDLVREAWRILSDDELRKRYDAQIKSGTKKAFVLVDLDDMNYSAESATYSFPCRCGVGGGFSISEEDLEKGRDLVDCRGCSSQIRVSYEIIAE